MSRPVVRVGEVLDLFSLGQPEWGVSEAAAALELPKSSISRTMSTLAQQGLLRRTAKGKYRLGWRFITLSQTLLKTTDFRSEARRAMEHLASRFGDAVHLLVLDNGRAVYVQKTQPPGSVPGLFARIGLSIPAHSSAAGKVLLAHRPWEEALTHFGKSSAATPGAIVAAHELRDELEAVQEKGYACDVEETMPGICCVSAPIRDRTGEVVAAMSFVVQAHRFTAGRDDRYRAAIVEAASMVSENIGWARTPAVGSNRIHRATGRLQRAG